MCGVLFFFSNISNIYIYAAQKCLVQNYIYVEYKILEMFKKKNKTPHIRLIDWLLFC